MFKDKKYKLIRVGKREWPKSTWADTYRWSQLKALKDIPEHGVKAGDLGGFVQDPSILSQEGSCWIGGNAMVYGWVNVSGNAYIGGNVSILNNYSSRRIVVKGNASVTGNAKIWIGRFDGEGSPDNGIIIDGNASISDEVTIVNVKRIGGKAKISGNAILSRCENILDSSEVFGNAKINQGASLVGATKVYDNAVVDQNASIISSTICDSAVVHSYETVQNLILDKNGRRIKDPSAVLTVQASESKVKELPAGAEELSDALIAFNEITASIASYETDIVKIIKYPVMTDRTDAMTRAMGKALNVATRLSRKPGSDAFENAVSELEDAFLAAESNALKIAGTSLSEEDRKKTERAKDLLAIAANEGSAENEKKVAFKQAFKQLEGAVVVPESAIDAFRIKIGLKELEA
jgi:serine acetyltransferase